MPTETASAFRKTMELTTVVHGQLSGRERQIAETAARTGYEYAMRETVEILQDRVAQHRKASS